MSRLAKAVPAIGGLPAEQIRYGYDAWGRLGSVRGASLVLGGTDFSPIGQLSQFMRYDGTNSGYSTYGYDNATGAVLAIKDNAVYGNEGHYVADRKFTRDAVGNVTSSTVTATHPQATTQKTCYTYDGLRQLTRAWTPNASTECSASPSAATMGGAAPMWVDYAYDTATGNRTSVTSHSPMGSVSTREYAYPAAGSARPHAVQQITGAAGQGTGSYGYDESGNQVSRPGQELTFNTVGKVSKVVAGSEEQSNVYDADGNLLLRVSSTDGASLFLGDTTVTQAAGSSVQEGFRTYSGAEGKPVAQRSAKTGTAGSVLTWLFTNVEGTVDVQTTANGSSTVQSYRDPFGAPIAGSAQAWADGAGYMNKQVAEATALTNVGARTYDPAIGKFVSVDPVIDTNLPQQNTGYAYSGNNPTTYMDPSGLKFAIDCGCGKTTPYAAPPRFRNSQRFGTQLTSFATSLIKTSGESDTNARATAYVAQNAGSFFKSEQGALIRAWMSGNLPGMIKFGEESRITQGLRDTDHMRRYQERVYLALSQSSNIPDPVNYDAKSYSLKNPNTIQDLFTFGNWEDASNSQRSLAVIGSYQVAPPQVSMTSANSADVTYRLENDITVGSLISFSDQLRQFGYSVASDSGPLSTVHTSFTWTESYSW